MEAIVAKSSEHVHRRPNSITGSEGGFQDLNKSGQGATLAAGKTTWMTVVPHSKYAQGSSMEDDAEAGRATGMKNWMIVLNTESQMSG